MTLFGCWWLLALITGLPLWVRLYRDQSCSEDQWLQCESVPELRTGWEDELDSRALAKLAIETGGDWGDSPSLHSFRARNTPIKLNPFEIMYGRPLHMPYLWGRKQPPPTLGQFQEGTVALGQGAYACLEVIREIHEGQSQDHLAQQSAFQGLGLGQATPTQDIRT